VVVAAQSIQTPDPVRQLAARLDDPTVAQSLHTLLDHADLLAVLVLGLDGLARRGDVITDALVDSVSELRALQRPAGLPDAAELLRIGQQIGAMVGPAVDILPTVEYLLRSDLGDTRVIDIAAMASRAIVAGSQVSEAASEKERRPGLFALWRASRDKDTRRALGFGLGVAKALGRELKAAEGAPTTRD
jgi:hypothetical protein